MPPVYDDPEFFEGYRRLARSQEGLAGAAEWPAMRALLSDLPGLRVVDLGCGYGWFCRWAREQGASGVLGIDVSEKMLAEARARTADTGIDYRREDLEHLELPEAAFDLAYSSLALHYVEDLAGVFRSVQGALAAGGRFVFSIEHPIYMAALHPEWVIGANGQRSWPVDGYLVEGPRTTNWLAPGVVKQHRTIGSTVELLLAAGFTLTHLVEWGPTDEQIVMRPGLAEDRERPMFLLVAARRI